MKILLLPDLKGWAFANIAKAIQKFGTHDYDIEYEHQFRKERAKELPKEKIDFDKYDVIVAFAPWMVWSNLPKEKTICICHEDFEMDHWNINGYKKVFVTTDISLEYIKSKTRAVKVQAGYDSSIFNSSYICKALSKPLKIGWVGAWSGHVNKKGYEQYYLPLGKWFDLRIYVNQLTILETFGLC